MKKVLIFSLFTTLVLSKLIILNNEFKIIDKEGYLAKIWIFIKKILNYLEVSSLSVNNYVDFGKGFEKSSIMTNVFLTYFPFVFMFSFIIYIIYIIVKSIFKKRGD